MRSFKASFFFLDGLDEASSSTQAAILDGLSSLGGRVFMISRHLKALAFPDSSSLHKHSTKAGYQALHYSEDSASQDLDPLLEGPAFREEAISTILISWRPPTAEYEDGQMSVVSTDATSRFLHAILHLEVPEQCLTIRDAESALSSFPTLRMFITRLGSELSVKASTSTRHMYQKATEHWGASMGYGHDPTN
jgi:hypothetical protein